MISIALLALLLAVGGSVLVTETAKRTYRITTDCEAFDRARKPSTK